MKIGKCKGQSVVNLTWKDFNLIRLKIFKFFVFLMLTNFTKILKFLKIKKIINKKIIVGNFIKISKIFNGNNKYKIFKFLKKKNKP